MFIDTVKARNADGQFPEVFLAVSHPGYND